MTGRPQINSIVPRFVEPPRNPERFTYLALHDNPNISETHGAALCELIEHLSLTG